MADSIPLSNAHLLKGLMPVNPHALVPIESLTASPTSSTGSASVLEWNSNSDSELFHMSSPASAAALTAQPSSTPLSPFGTTPSPVGSSSDAGPIVDSHYIINWPREQCEDSPQAPPAPVSNDGSLPETIADIDNVPALNEHPEELNILIERMFFSNLRDTVNKWQDETSGPAPVEGATQESTSSPRSPSPISTPPPPADISMTSTVLGYVPFDHNYTERASVTTASPPRISMFDAPSPARSAEASIISIAEYFKRKASEKAPASSANGNDQQIDSVAEERPASANSALSYFSPATSPAPRQSTAPVSVGAPNSQVDLLDGFWNLSTQNVTQNARTLSPSNVSSDRGRSETDEDEEQQAQRDSKPPTPSPEVNSVRSSAKHSPILPYPYANPTEAFRYFSRSTAPISGPFLFSQSASSSQRNSTHKSSGKGNNDAAPSRTAVPVLPHSASFPSGNSVSSWVSPPELEFRPALKNTTSSEPPPIRAHRPRTPTYGSMYNPFIHAYTPSGSTASPEPVPSKAPVNTPAHSSALNSTTMRQPSNVYICQLSPSTVSASSPPPFDHPLSPFIASAPSPPPFGRPLSPFIAPAPSPPLFAASAPAQTSASSYKSNATRKPRPPLPALPTTKPINPITPPFTFTEALPKPVEEVGTPFAAAFPSTWTCRSPPPRSLPPSPAILRSNTDEHRNRESCTRPVPPASTAWGWGASVEDEQPTAPQPWMQPSPSAWSDSTWEEPGVQKAYNPLEDYFPSLAPPRQEPSAAYQPFSPAHNAMYNDNTHFNGPSSITYPHYTNPYYYVPPFPRLPSPSPSTYRPTGISPQNQRRLRFATSPAVAPMTTPPWCRPSRSPATQIPLTAPVPPSVPPAFAPMTGFMDQRDGLLQGLNYSYSSPAPVIPPMVPDASHGRWYTPSMKYTFGDASVTFRVEATLFSVHRHFFERHSEYFRNLLSTYRYSEGNHIFLPRVKTDDFERLLSIFYPTELCKPEITTLKGWTSILTLAQKWGMTQVRALALQNIGDHASPIEKIVIAHQHYLHHPGPAWLLAAYKAICTRPTPLSLQEAEKLDMRRVIGIWEVQNEVLRMGSVRSVRDDKRIEELIKDTFGAFESEEPAAPIWSM